jgi:hypothetical protein
VLKEVSVTSFKAWFNKSNWEAESGFSQKAVRLLTDSQPKYSISMDSIVLNYPCRQLPISPFILLKYITSSFFTSSPSTLSTLYYEHRSLFFLHSLFPYFIVLFLSFCPPSFLLFLNRFLRYTTKRQISPWRVLQRPYKCM